MKAAPSPFRQERFLHSFLHTTAHCLLSTTCCALPTLYYLLRTTYYLLLATDYLLSTTCYSLPTTYYSLPTGEFRQFSRPVRSAAPLRHPPHREYGSHRFRLRFQGEVTGRGAARNYKSAI